MDNLQPPVLSNTENVDNQENMDCQTNTEANGVIASQTTPESEAMADNDSTELLSESSLIAEQSTETEQSNEDDQEPEQIVSSQDEVPQQEEIPQTEEISQEEEPDCIAETPVEETPSSLEKAEVEELQHERKDETVSSEEEPEEEINDDFFDHLNREQVVKALEEVVAQKDVTKIKRKVSLLKIRFIQLNKEYKDEQLQMYLAEDNPREEYQEETDQCENRFNNAFNKYKAKKQRHLEEVEKIRQENFAKKQALLEELRILIESDSSSLKQVYDRFGEIQAQWKEIGAVPATEVNIMWQNYHFYVEKFFDKVRMNRELRDLDMKKNLERKLELCEKAEALILETSITSALTLMQEYRQQWRSIGMVEEEKREEVWRRFNAALEAVSKNCGEYFMQREKELKENYKAKQELCHKVEILAQSPINTMDQLYIVNGKISALIQLWKTIGPAPKDVHNEIWQRFNKTITVFFNEKKTLQTQLKEKETENYNLKLNLCIQAEAIALRTDWKEATSEILNLQKDWKEIGPVSRKQNDYLWNRYRKACNTFFENKDAALQQSRQNEGENIIKREQLIQAVKDYVFTHQVNQDFETLKDFQRQWTEIGYTSMNIRKKLLNEFSEVINNRFTELKRSIQKTDKKSYEQYVSQVTEKSSKGNQFLSKERQSLLLKIKELTDNVNLWENNLGFFAKSKNRSILTEQFEKKLEKAKEELAALKANLEVIEKQMPSQSTPPRKEDKKRS